MRRIPRVYLKSLVYTLLVGMMLVVILLLGVGLAYRAVPPVSTLMLARYAMFQPVAREWVDFTALPFAASQAVIAAEDGKFCQHHGVDWPAIHQVIEASNGKSPARGASTVAMQVARNLFLWQGRSYIRKSLEIPLAHYLDFVWPKKRMMEVYLNIAEWGEGIFGIQAAARHYFGKEARQLSRHEVSLLVAALPSPIKRNPAKPSPYHRSYAATIQARMGQSQTDCLSRR